MVQKKQFIVNQHFTAKEKALSLLLFNLAITCKYTYTHTPKKSFFIQRTLKLKELMNSELNSYQIRIL